MPNKFKIKMIEAPPPPPEKGGTKKFKGLRVSIMRDRDSDHVTRTCQRRGLEVVINTVDDGRVVAAIAGSLGVAKTLNAALQRAVTAWDKDNRPRRKRRKT